MIQIRGKRVRKKRWVLETYYLKRVFSKSKTWIILFLWLVIIFFIFLMTTKKNGWYFNTKMEFVEDLSVKESVRIVNPKISNVNNFFACVFPNLIFLPVLMLTYVFSPLSWIFWGEIEEIGQKTQEDGTDLFFLSTEIPTSRKKIFWRKITFLTSFFSVLYLVLFALPLSFLLWKANYFSNFTGLQTFLFLGWNFVITPLLFLVPLIILLFSLASLKSVWYTILKWFGRLSVIFIILLGFLAFNALSGGGGIGEKILEWGKDISNWLSQNYLLTTLTIMGVVIGLAVFTLSLAYKDYQKKDLQ